MVIADPNQNLYYLFYTATTLPDAIHLNCSNSKPPMNVSLRDNQNIGYASSSSLYGPWKRSSANPILSPRRNNESLWDSMYVCNPDPYYLSNGSMVLIYKAMSLKHNGSMNTGIAMIEGNGKSWDGPYKRYDTFFDDKGNCEDGFFWEQIDNDGDNNGEIESYHMLYHCGCNGEHSWSLDLMEWNYGEEQPWCEVQDVNGTDIVFKRRERPQIIFEGEGNINAKYLYNAVQPQKGVSFNFVQEL